MFIPFLMLMTTIFYGFVYKIMFNKEDFGFTDRWLRRYVTENQLRQNSRNVPAISSYIGRYSGYNRSTR